jgi:hypothetical protein
MTGIRLFLPIFLLTLTSFPLSGSGSEDPGTSEPPPKISLTTTCLNGLTVVTLRNTGGAMPEAGHFEAVFADGERDTLLIKAGAGASVVCQLSNIHGGVTVTNKKWGITVTAGDCLLNTFSNLLAFMDLGSMIPSPLGKQDVTVCTYTVYIRNFKYDAPTFELVRTDGGLVLKYVFRNLRGDVKATGNSWACADIDGNFKVAAVISETAIIIDEGETPEVSLGKTKTSVQGLEVNIAGSLGFVADWILDYFNDTLTREISRAVEAELNALAGSDLSSLVIVRSACGEAE